MRFLFDGKILTESLLHNVQSKQSETEGKWDAIALVGEPVILKTFDTEREAKDYINRIGVAVPDTVDMREEVAEGTA